MVAYTEAINLLNYSAVVVPVTKANSDIDLVDHTYIPISGEDKENWEACKYMASSRLQHVSSFDTFRHR